MATHQEDQPPRHRKHKVRRLDHEPAIRTHGPPRQLTTILIRTRGVEAPARQQLCLGTDRPSFHSTSTRKCGTVMDHDHIPLIAHDAPARRPKLIPSHDWVPMGDTMGGAPAAPSVSGHSAPNAGGDEEGTAAPEPKRVGRFGRDRRATGPMTNRGQGRLGADAAPGGDKLKKDTTHPPYA
jgi:hypothetical protein